MWNEPTKERLAKLPRIHETKDVPLKEKLVYLHFFVAGCDWYICETDRRDLMWGFCILNADYDMAEWGYVSLAELCDIKVGGWIEVDCETEDAWEVRRAIDVEKIRIAQGWKKDETTSDLAREIISIFEGKVVKNGVHPTIGRGV